MYLNNPLIPEELDILKSKFHCTFNGSTSLLTCDFTSYLIYSIGSVNNLYYLEIIDEYKYQFESYCELNQLGYFFINDSVRYGREQVDKIREKVVELYNIPQ